MSDTAILERLDRLESKLDTITKTQNADELLDLQGFANLAGISMWGAYRLTKDAPFAKSGRKLYIRRSDAIDWLTRNRRETRSEALSRAARESVGGVL